MKQIVIIALLMRATLYGQSPDSLIAVVQARNPSLQAGYLFSQALQTRVVQAKQWPEPEASLNVIALPLPNQSALPSATLGWMQPIPWKGILGLKSTIAGAEADISFKEVEVERLELHLRIRKAYWELFDLEQRTGIIRENIAILKTLERLALSNMELGTGTFTDVLDIQMRILELEKEIQQKENARRIPTAEINQILNRSASEPVKVQSTALFPDFPISADGLIQQIRQNYPGLTVLAQRKAVSRQRQELNRLEGKPGLTVGLDYAVMRKQEGVHADDGKDMWMPRIGVRVPLFRETYLARDREEHLLQGSLDARTQELDNMLAATVEQGFSKLQEARIMYELAQGQRPLVESALQVLRDRFSTNGVGLEGILRYESVLLNLKIDEIQAIAAGYMAIAELQSLLK